MSAYFGPGLGDCDKSPTSDVYAYIHALHIYAYQTQTEPRMRADRKTEGCLANCTILRVLSQPDYKALVSLFVRASNTCVLSLYSREAVKLSATSLPREPETSASFV